MKIPTENTSGSLAKRDVLRCGIAAVVGVLVSLIQRISHGVPAQVDKPGFPEWIREYDRVARSIVAWPWNMVFAILLIFMLALLRFRRGAWALAFCLGLVFGTIASNAFS
jgi:hypothetical protein